ncbi:MAG: hypothetical protein M3065_13855 [Actinomycetota bacterium]|nr:hypothetical protein [Actinomycetota bacterium]
MIPPAIDPLAPKNMAFSTDDAVYVCGQFGIDVDRPLLCQVSRFDPWKDPLGVIDAHRIVKDTHPDVQLALVGSMATDDPEGWDYFNATVARADGDPDIHIYNNFSNVGSIEVSALQLHADGESGFLVTTVKECAQRALEILADPSLGKRLGRAGKEAARARFLMPRLLRDWLSLFTHLAVA